MLINIILVLDIGYLIYSVVTKRVGHIRIALCAAPPIAVLKFLESDGWDTFWYSSLLGAVTLLVYFNSGIMSDIAHWLLHPAFVALVLFGSVTARVVSDAHIAFMVVYAYLAAMWLRGIVVSVLAAREEFGGRRVYWLAHFLSNTLLFLYAVSVMIRNEANLTTMQLAMVATASGLILLTFIHTFSQQVDKFQTKVKNISLGFLCDDVYQLTQFEYGREYRMLDGTIGVGQKVMYLTDAAEITPKVLPKDREFQNLERFWVREAIKNFFLNRLLQSIARRFHW